MSISREKSLKKTTLQISGCPSQPMTGALMHLSSGSLCGQAPTVRGGRRLGRGRLGFRSGVGTQRLGGVGLPLPLTVLGLKADLAEVVLTRLTVHFSGLICAMLAINDRTNYTGIVEDVPSHSTQ